MTNVATSLQGWRLTAQESQEREQCQNMRGSSSWKKAAIKEMRIEYGVGLYNDLLKTMDLIRILLNM